jgi:tetratricopeptide (TPR) repeat protein
MVVHVVHWKLAGRTLAPLELNEVMYTMELGVVTAGFLFMVAIVLLSAIFGRFFCSWGCHILALEDLSAWLLARLGIKPRAIRSRLLAWVPVGAAFYMFLWPQVVRLWERRSAAELHLRTDAQGWASFSTENFWRNLPTPTVIALTFFVVGFLMVYVLGTRGFCAYACPYGAVFRLVDRLAPGRIRTRARDCLDCGACTAACTSHVRVHEELSRYGMVVNPACLKDLDCVAACPQGRVHYGFGRPSALKVVQLDVSVQRTYDFTLVEELVLLAAFLVVLFVYRGLYDFVPFLLTVALGVVAGYTAVVGLRLWRRPEVRFNRWPLKVAGRFLPASSAFVVIGACFAGLTVHSTVARYDSFAAGRRVAALRAGGNPDDRLAAIRHLERLRNWRLMDVDREDVLLAELYAHGGDWQNAEAVSREVLVRSAANMPARLLWIRALLHSGRIGDGTAELTRLASAQRLDADTRYAIAGGFFELGRPQDAMGQLREAIRLRPGHAMAHFDLGALLIENGDLAGGVEHLQRTVALRPEFSDAHHNLALALALSGDLPGALGHAQTALRLSPDDPQARAFLDELKSQASRRLPAPG